MHSWVRSIRVTLTLWYTFLVLLTLLGFAFVSYYYTEDTLSANLDKSLGKEVRWVRDFIQPQASKVKPGRRSVEALLRSKPHTQRPDSTTALGPLEEADEIWNQIYEHTLLSPKKTYIQVADRRGAVLYRSYSLGDDTLRLGEELGMDTTLISTVWLNGEAIRVAATRDRNFTILVGYRLAELREVLDNLFSIFLILIPVTIALSLGGGFYLAHQSLRPVDEVTQRARKITAENLHQTIPVRGVDDEIGRLTSTLNEMIGRLHESFARIRQFSADASHELRTPLTVMRGEIELSLRHPRSGEEYRRVLESTLEEILSLTTIVENLLTLAKADQELYQPEFSQVHVRALLAELYEDCEILAGKKGITLHMQDIPDAIMVGDRVRLRQMLLNLVDNAIKYTAPGGSVSIGMHRRDGEAIVTVRDTGIGISEEHIEKIFDRFYRVDKARARELGGTGLGLSIARWIAELHRGRLTVESTPRVGSTFTVQLPLR